ncbi:hypothetical protein ACTXT7_013010 [Hymenolepis weldensis]
MSRWGKLIRNRGAFNSKILAMALGESNKKINLRTVGYDYTKRIKPINDSNGRPRPMLQNMID